MVIAPPFLTIDKESGGIVVPKSKDVSVAELACGERLFGEGISPSEAIPVVNMEDNGNDGGPQVGMVDKFPDPFFCRRATIASLRRIEFDESRVAIGRDRYRRACFRATT